MLHESEKPSEISAKKQSKYINIQGFAELDNKGNFLFQLPASKDVFKVSLKETVSQEFFQTKVGAQTISFANLYIPYSEETIKALKQGTHRLTEDTYSFYDRTHPNVVIGGAPKPGTGPVKGMDVSFRTKVIEGAKIVEVVDYREE